MGFLFCNQRSEAARNARTGEHLRRPRNSRHKFVSLTAFTTHYLYSEVSRYYRVGTPKPIRIYDSLGAGNVFEPGSLLRFCEFCAALVRRIRFYYSSIICKVPVTSDMSDPRGLQSSLWLVKQNEPWDSMCGSFGFVLERMDVYFYFKSIQDQYTCVLNIIALMWRCVFFVVKYSTTLSSRNHVLRHKVVLILVNDITYTMAD